MENVRYFPFKKFSACIVCIHLPQMSSQKEDKDIRMCQLHIRINLVCVFLPFYHCLSFDSHLLLFYLDCIRVNSISYLWVVADSFYLSYAFVLWDKIEK